MELPELVADAVCDGNIMNLAHYCFGSSVHQVESSTIIGLFEVILGAQSISHNRSEWD